MKTFLLVVLCFVAAARADADEPDVLVLTKDNFDETIKQGVVLVEFYAPWCGYCKKLAPEYSEAATTLKQQGSNAVLAKVDATIETSLGEQFKIQGFPTLILFKDGVKSDYQGGRTAAEIVKYINKKLLPVVSEISSDDAFRQLIPSAAGNDVLVAANLKADQVAAFNAVANKNSESYTFVSVTNKDVAAAHNIAEGSVAVFKPFDELRNNFNGDIATELEEFLKENSLPYVDEITPNNYKKYVDRALPILWLFLDPSQTAEKDALEAELRKVAPEFRGLSFVWLNGVQYAQMVTKMALSGKLPALAIETADGLHFTFDESADITADNLRPWLTQWKSGDLKPKIKSEAVPADPKGEDGVYVIVGDSFKEVVFDKDNDVLVEFYAPWCGHCKSLAPIYSELANELKDVKGIVIAKMDLTANDATSEFKVQGFPTLKLIKAETNEIVDYDGARTKDGFIAFLKANAKNGNKIGASAGGNDEL